MSAATRRFNARHAKDPQRTTYKTANLKPSMAGLNLTWDGERVRAGTTCGHIKGFNVFVSGKTAQPAKITCVTCSKTWAVDNGVRR